MSITKNKFSEEELCTIKNELLSLGVKPNISGIWYWSLAIKWVRENESLMFNIKDLYNDLAKYCKTSQSKVERAMRYAIHNLKDEIKSKYNYNGKLTNKAFLSLQNYSNKI